MNEQRWLRVESIVLEAADRDISARKAFLDEACADDEGLRQEVESLLRFERGAHEFLERSAMQAAAYMATADVALDAADLNIDGYTIGEFLGAGGMGEVYAARDTRLERDVALKIIRRAPDDVGATARIEEEARSASRLNHPNIVTIHAVGSQLDVSYIVMELVSGQTLRDLMAAGPMPFAPALDIATQLGEGLAAAHDMAVVHRDLKPENIMVTPGGLLKILDFGIARRDRGSASDTPLATSSGPVRRLPSSSLAGTAGYMSPEQAARGRIDHRSDQFSFAAIVYEMLTGQRVSERDSAAGISERHASIEPSLRAVVDRCLKKTPDERYSSTRDLANAVRRIRDSMTQAHARRLTRRQVLATAAVAGAAVAAALWRLPFGGAPRRRLAVLPFANLSGDANAEILANGITEVLIRQLTGAQKNLTVIGRQTAFRLKGGPRDPREVGRLLNVDEVLTGSLTIRGGRVLVDLELADARTGARIWGDELGRPDLDVLAIQNEIAAAIITRGFSVEASAATLRELSRGLTSDRDAYLLFLRAVHHLRQGTEADYLEARNLLLETVKQDGMFAVAHLTLASTYSIMIIDGYEAPRDAWPQSHRHVDRALALDGQLPEAHAERGVELFFYERDWAGAQREWDIALQSPRELQGELLSPYVLQHWALGRNADALRFAQTAREVDPLSPMLAMREADMLAAVGDSSSAVERYTALIQSVPDPAALLIGLAQVRRLQRRFDDAISELRRAFAEVDDGPLATLLATARGNEGCRAIDRYLARGELEALSERAASKQYVSPLSLARVHARLEDPDKAFTFLADAFEHRAAGLVFLNVDPAWDNIRRDRRFGTAIRRVGFPQTGQRG
jgi:eukaryotic-like serine/threonine-protein kinase